LKHSKKHFFIHLWIVMFSSFEKLIFWCEYLTFISVKKW
jgi:hypothetical protein